VRAWEQFQQLKFHGEKLERLAAWGWNLECQKKSFSLLQSGA
jgi:hypothetical protein